VSAIADTKGGPLSERIINVGMTTEMYERLRRLSYEEHITMARFMREVVERALDERDAQRT